MIILTQEKAPILYEEVDGVLYPYSEEEEPLGQGQQHFEIVKELVNMVQGLMLENPQAGIFSDLFVFWQEGDLDKKHAPDLLVFPRVRKLKQRKSLQLWNEPSIPIFVMEVISERSEKDDWEKKKQIYQDYFRVPEYFLCDSRRNPSPCWGYRLTSGIYTPIIPNEQGRLWSESLQAWIGTDEQGKVQIWDRSGKVMPRYEEALRLYQQAIQERDQAIKKAEQEARKADQERKQAERETKRAEQEAKRAEQEASQRKSAEARVQELEEELRRLREIRNIDTV